MVMRERHESKSSEELQKKMQELHRKRKETHPGSLEEQKLTRQIDELEKELQALQATSKPAADAVTPEGHEKPPGWVLVVCVASGLVFLLLLLGIAVFIPRPTTFQVFVFRVVLALAAAAFGATIPGFLNIKIPLWGKGLISAGGALALFVLVYHVNPPALILQPQPEPQPVVTIAKQSLSGVIFDGNGEPIAGVKVSLVEFNVTTTTDEQGTFAFEVEAEHQRTVRLMAQKDGFATYRQDVTLGNTNLNFKMVTIHDL